MIKYKKGRLILPFLFRRKKMSTSRVMLNTTLLDDTAPPAPNTQTNTSRDFGKILSNVYKPGFIDQDSLENMKMAVNRELGEISKAFFQTTERTTDGIKRVDEIITDTEELNDLINQVDQESINRDTLLSNRITTVETKWGVRVNAGNKITGIILNNSGNQAPFSVQYDRFIISDGTVDTGAPFEVIGGETKIKNIAVGDLQSDNWNGSLLGWQILKNGDTTFNNTTIRGHVEASSGSFVGDINATTFIGIGGSSVKVNPITNLSTSETDGWILVGDIPGSTFFSSLEDSLDVTVAGVVHLSATGNVDITTSTILDGDSVPTSTTGLIQRRVISGNGSSMSIQFQITKTASQIKLAGGSIKIYARVLLASDTGNGGGSITSDSNIGGMNLANISITRN